jgi:hypothetical protein
MSARLASPPSDATAAAARGTDVPPRVPSIGWALRQSVTDFYFNSWRLAPANVLWALVVAVVLLAAVAWPPALALLAFAAVPLAGIHRLAALIARDEPASFADFLDGCRRFGVAAVGLGTGAMVLALVLGTNVVVSFQSDSPLAWFVGATALYGLVGLASWLVAAWPILVDPHREELPVRRRLALAGLVLAGRPVRLLVLTLVLGVLLAISTVMFAAVAVAAMAYAALVACRVVLPTADALEARLPEGRLPG